MGDVAAVLVHQIRDVPVGVIGVEDRRNAEIRAQNTTNCAGPLHGPAQVEAVDVGVGRARGDCSRIIAQPSEKKR